MDKYMNQKSEIVHVVQEWGKGLYLMSDGSVVDKKTLDKWKVKEEKENEIS